MKVYTLFCILFLYASSIHAQVIYKDINPDTTIHASIQEMFARYNIDLNNDGTVDFYVKHYNSETFKAAEFYTNIGGTGEVLTDTNYHPLALEPGVQINTSSVKWVNSATSFSSTALLMNENWEGKEDRYVGLRLKYGSGWKYGWIRISIPSYIDYIRIKDYAYNSNLNQTILAGEGLTSGINHTQFSKLSNTSVIPNPVMETSRIVCGEVFVGSTFTLYSLEGKVMFQTELMNNSVPREIFVFEPGIYFYSINNKKKILGINKLIIQ